MENAGLGNDGSNNRAEMYSLAFFSAAVEILAEVTLERSGHGAASWR